MHRAVLTIFYIRIHFGPVDGFAHQQPYLIYAMRFICVCVIAFPWINAGIIIVLPSMVIPSIIAISSLE